MGFNQDVALLQKKHNKMLLSKREAAGELNISVATIDRLRKKGAINHKQIGGQVFFTIHDIAKYVLEGDMMDNTDGNLAALKRHDDAVEWIEKLEADFDLDTKEGFEILEDLIGIIVTDVKRYEQEFGVDFRESARASILAMMGEL